MARFQLFGNNESLILSQSNYLLAHSVKIACMHLHTLNNVQ